MTDDVTITLTADRPAFSIELVTPAGTFSINGGLSQRPGDQALVVFIDTPPVEEVTGSLLRINVNDEGKVFGYDDGAEDD